MIANKQIPNISDKRAIFVSSSILVLGIVGLLLYITNFQHNLIETSALESAKLYSQALAEFRTIYTAKVVQNVNSHPDFEVTHDYENKKNAIPLPATLSMELGKAIGRHLSGAETWLYSDYPFPWRREAGGGLRDEFAVKAWKSLNKNPNQPYYEFVPDYKGRQVLRYATADLMRPSCIGCHNTHPQSPKNNWKVADVRGVLEIVHPMEAVFEKTANGKYGLFFLAVVIGLFGVLSLLFLIRSYQKITRALTTEVQMQTKDLREAKEAAEAASRDLSQIMNSSPDFIFKSRIDNFQFTEVNQTACEYYGYSQDEFSKMTIFDIEVEPPLKEQVRKLYDTTPVGKVIEVYGTNKKKNGDTFRVHVRFLKLDEEFALANVRDITDQQRAEADLVRAKESAETANIDLIQSNEALQLEIIERKNLEGQLAQAQELESIGLLAAGIAHEINTPIQYVGDNTRFLSVAFGRMKTVLDKNNELINAAKEDAVTEKLITEVESVIEDTKMEYMLEEIPMSIDETLGGIERVATIVRAMKEFSHPGTQEKTLADINKALENTITVACNEWKYVAEIEKDFEPALPLVPCLLGELNQVFLNIIVNAAHAIAEVIQDGSEGKGTIKVRTSSAGDWVEIEISDSGTGIPEEVRSKIFDPFFTTKEVGKGTGQGLAIAHNVVVEKHGGSLNFETEIGQGTMFVIRLPIKAPNN